MNALDRLQMLCVADVMTRDVVSVSTTHSMLDVACRFVEHDVTGAPVTDEEGRCVGFFSSADFLRRELRARQESADSASGDSLAQQAEVGRFMSGRVTTIKPGDSLLAAARLMCENHLHRLPVVDDSGHVVGILSTMDVVAALVNSIDEMDSASFPGLGS
jgi:CBS-domain-containing membrane protein